MFHVVRCHWLTDSLNRFPLFKLCLGTPLLRSSCFGSGATRKHTQEEEFPGSVCAQGNRETKRKQEVSGEKATLYGYTFSTWPGLSVGSAASTFTINGRV